jgi:hypothetical protein
MRRKYIFSGRAIVLMAISVLFGLGIWAGIIYSQGDPSTPTVNAGTNFQVCTGGVDQDACFSPTSSVTRLNWTYSSSAYGQTSFWAEVDNSGDVNGVFPSPEINTGWLNSSNQYYDIPAGFLQASTTYYWKISVADAHGSWSGWTCADVSFTTPAACITNHAPSATDLQTAQPDYCTVSSPSVIFSWTFTDPDSEDTQYAYQVQADNSIDFSSPEVNSGMVISSSNSYATSPGVLSWNTTYYWRLKVWDHHEQNPASVWILGSYFYTPVNAFPTIDFTWLPVNPTVDENTQFVDQSTVYGGALKSAWYWTFQNGSPATSTIQNAISKFTSAGSKSITLKVTDSNGYFCTGGKTLTTLLNLPEWKEIPPF